MRIVITTIVCTLLFVLIGCSSEQAPTEVAQIPAENIVKDRPVGAGATIIRYEGGLALNFWDVRRQLQVIIGVDMPVFCGGDFVPDIVDVMEITNPVDQNIVNQLIHGSDMYCWVYPLYEFDCERYLTEADNALERSWGGTCWCNPPYGRTMMAWVRKCALEAAGGATVALLCFASTDTAWFRYAWAASTELRLYTGRISFLTPEGERTTPAPKGSCLFVFRPSTSAGACWARLMEAPNADTDSGGS